MGIWRKFETVTFVPAWFLEKITLKDKGSQRILITNPTKKKAKNPQDLNNYCIQLQVSRIPLNIRICGISSLVLTMWTITLQDDLFIFFKDKGSQRILIINPTKKKGKNPQDLTITVFNCRYLEYL